jgi:cyanate permease
VLIVVWSGLAPIAAVGIVLWGLGAALGFPVGMSAAADDPAAAAGRVSVVASIGYCAFLAGPPLIGFLGEHASVLKALTVVAGLLAVAALVAAALRPLPTAGAPDAAAVDDGNS